MRITEYLEPRAVVDIASTTRDEVIAELVQVAVASYDLLESATHITDVVQARERLGSTGLGGGVAIPHERFPSMARHVLVVGRSAMGVPFEAPDEEPVQVFFLVLGPPRVKEHLALLAAIARVCKTDNFVQRVLAAADAGALYHLLDGLEV
jgi:PTS system nitrogen regulatory IIA component